MAALSYRRNAREASHSTKIDFSFISKEIAENPPHSISEIQERTHILYRKNGGRPLPFFILEKTHEYIYFYVDEIFQIFKYHITS